MITLLMPFEYYFHWVAVVYAAIGSIQYIIGLIIILRLRSKTEKIAKMKINIESIIEATVYIYAVLISLNII